MSQSIPDNQVNRLEGNVVLIINGLRESGQVLAGLLAQQGSDVAIVDSKLDQELAHRIKQDVITNGRRCLILTPANMPGEKRAFPQLAIKKIIDTFGHLDAFISYSGTETAKSRQTIPHPNGHQEKPNQLFDQEGLTIAAVRHIFNQ